MFPFWQCCQQPFVIHKAVGIHRDSIAPGVRVVSLQYANHFITIHFAQTFIPLKALIALAQMPANP